MHSYVNMRTAKNEGDAKILQKRNDLHYQSSKRAIAVKPHGGDIHTELFRSVSITEDRKCQH